MLFLLVNLSYTVSRLAKPDFDNARKLFVFEFRPGARSNNVVPVLVDSYSMLFDKPFRPQAPQPERFTR